MSKMKVYDETVNVNVVRSGVPQSVMFCEIKKDDVLVDFPCAIVDEDSHFSGDASYEGWLFFDTTGCVYFPEDFGASLVN